jgi:hypothetical protein
LRIEPKDESIAARNKNTARRWLSMNKRVFFVVSLIFTITLVAVVVILSSSRDSGDSPVIPIRENEEDEKSPRLTVGEKENKSEVNSTKVSQTALVPEEGSSSGPLGSERLVLSGAAVDETTGAPIAILRASIAREHSSQTGMSNRTLARKSDNKFWFDKKVAPGLLKVEFKNTPYVFEAKVNKSNSFEIKVPTHNYIEVLLVNSNEQPVAGISVKLRGLQSLRGFCTTIASNAEGKAVFRNLPPSKYSIDIIGNTACKIPSSLQDSKEIILCNTPRCLVLRVESVQVLTGTVFDEASGELLQGFWMSYQWGDSTGLAEMNLDDPTKDDSWMTNPFSIPVMPKKTQKLYLTFAAPKFAPKVVELVPDKLGQEITVGLQKGFKIFGTLTDSLSRPLSGIRIYLEACEIESELVFRYSAVTSNDGEFLFCVGKKVETHYFVSVMTRDSGLRLEGQTVLKNPTSDTHVRLTLK